MRKAVISRQLANQIGNKLQVIVTLIERNERAEAIREAQYLAQLINQNVEIESSGTPPRT